MDEILSGLDEDEAILFLDDHKFWEVIQKYKPYIILTTHFKKLREKIYNESLIKSYYMDIQSTNDENTEFKKTYQLKEGKIPNWMCNPKTKEDLQKYNNYLTWDDKNYTKTKKF